MNGLDHESPKNEWRAWARRLHQDGVPERAGTRIRAHAAVCLGRLAPTTVVLFSSLPGEVNVDALSGLGRHGFALTRTPPTGWLTIHPWSAPRETHPYGFRQPVAGSSEVPVDRIGAVIVPGLAFDLDGIRLGRGAGYYDELFSRLPESVRRIGVIPSALLVDRLPRAPHDVAMHALVTEDGVISIS